MVPVRYLLRYNTRRRPNRLLLDDVTWVPGAGADEPWLRAFAAAAADGSKTSSALAAGVPAPLADTTMIAEVPFSSERRWSACLLERTGPDGTAERRAFVVGAPEAILQAPAEDRGLADAYERAAEAGMRGLLLAEAPSRSRRSGRGASQRGMGRTLAETPPRCVPTHRRSAERVRWGRVRFRDGSPAGRLPW